MGDSRHSDSMLTMRLDSQDEADCANTSIPFCCGKENMLTEFAITNKTLVCINL